MAPTAENLRKSALEYQSRNKQHISRGTTITSGADAIGGTSTLAAPVTPPPVTPPAVTPPTHNPSENASSGWKTVVLVLAAASIGAGLMYIYLKRTQGKVPAADHQAPRDDVIANQLNTAPPDEEEKTSKKEQSEQEGFSVDSPPRTPDQDQRTSNQPSTASASSWNLSQYLTNLPTFFGGSSHPAPATNTNEGHRPTA